ncbi:chromosome segregation ATPase [Vibrio variabilis]|uniref:Chromosome segregation ATPase n=1 Tax=Vibrio variabilis TaxID=990271 RepID=A0ABQ0JI02_9VIBR|nr:chromosome segregation ATPase [Vibrio variabilis]
MDDQNCSEANLTGFSITTFDDSDDQDGSKMKREVLSTSYDSVSGVYTEIKKSFIESGIHDGRVSESLSFSYIVDSSESERYVDFIGTWNAVETKAGCDVVATSTYVFDANGVTVNGEEFNSGCQLEEIEATATYEELSDMDFWWFTTNGLNNDSKATLTQLNSTIRWCDADDMESAYTECHDSDIKFNRWEYAPAGQNWDQGVLNRRTLSTGGQTVSTISMYKL